MYVYCVGVCVLSIVAVVCCSDVIYSYGFIVKAFALQVTCRKLPSCSLERAYESTVWMRYD